MSEDTAVVVEAADPVGRAMFIAFCRRWMGTNHLWTKALAEEWGDELRAIIEHVRADERAKYEALGDGEATLIERQCSLAIHYWGGREWTAQWSRPDAINVGRATGATEREAREKSLAMARLSYGETLAAIHQQGGK